MDFENYTDAMDKLLGYKIIEIGPGHFLAPYLSIADRKEVDYAVLDAAEKFEDAIKLYAQIGGVEDYIEFVRQKGYKPPKSYVLPAHKIHEIEEDYDSSLFVKSLEKIRSSIFDKIVEDSFFSKIKKDIEEYCKDLGIELNHKNYKDAYLTMVLDKTMEKTKRAMIIPIEKRTKRFLNQIFDKLGIKYYVFDVKEPVWIYRGKKEYHWEIPEMNEFVLLTTKPKKDKIRKFLE